MPAVTGICQPKPIVCTTVADCPSADFDCQKDYIMSTDAPCAADTKCPPPPQPQMSATGTCVAKPRACSTAADCPAPLVCQAEATKCAGGGSVGPDGIVTTTIPTTCTPGPSVCTWVPVTCATDSDCADPLYQCVKTGESGSCAGSAPVSCAKGETCPTPPAPVCTTQAIMNCLPRLVDCGSGQACPAGWSCFDFTSFGGVPSAWGSIASNKSCLPDGIILAAQGHASGGGQATVSSTPSGTSGSGAVDIGVASGTGGKNEAGGNSSGGGGTAPSGQGTPPSPVSPVPLAQGPQTANADAGVPLEPMAHSSGCAYGGSGQISLWLALSMAGLVARMARRRCKADR